MLLLLLALHIQGIKSQVFDIIVDPDGGTGYVTLQDAIDAVPDNAGERTVIFLHPGVYLEKVVIPPGKKNVSLIGDDPEKVIISWDDYAGKNGMSSAETYTCWADADDLYAENITFRNTAGMVGQALAIRTTGDRMVFKNCRFLGFQDTYYAHKRRQYNLQCFIEGGTDFIYGDATTVFDSCTLHCLRNGQYITAPADTKLVSETPDGVFYHGLLFRYCTITAQSGVGDKSYYLGRPWQPNASSVYISCRMDSHIRDEGWAVWSGENNHLSGCFAEFLSTDLEGIPVDTSRRVAWSKQLSSKEVEDHYNLAYFLTKSGVVWDPAPMTLSPDPPVAVDTNGNNLYWREVGGAAGYIIYRNDSIFAFSDSARIIFENMPEIRNEFTLRSVSQNGNLSRHSSGFILYGPLTTPAVPGPQLKVIVSGDQINVSEPVRFEIYAISGSLLKKGNGSDNIDISMLGRGIYLARFVRNNGEGATCKIIR